MKLIKCKRIGYALLALLFALFVTAMPVSMAGDCAGDESQASSSLADWILGTDFGVVSGAIDMDNRRVMLLFSQEKLASLSMQDDEDIRAAIDDILIFYHLAEAAGTYDIRYEAEDGAAAADESRYSGMCASSSKGAPHTQRPAEYDSSRSYETHRNVCQRLIDSVVILPMICSLHERQ